jgi:hypothetical protein
LGDFFQRQPKLGADLGEIPQDIAELVLEGLAVFFRDFPALVAKDLFDLAGDLAGLIG